MADQIKRKSSQVAKDNAKLAGSHNEDRESVPQNQIVLNPESRDAVQVPDPDVYPSANATQLASPHDEPSPNEVADEPVEDDEPVEQPSDNPDE